MTIEKALELALKVHAGHKDKAGAPYILHPLRVMLRMRGREEMIVAVLHDVVADSAGAVTLADLRRVGFSRAVVEAVACLTRREEAETYEQYIRRLAANPLARRVKLADLKDNMNLARLSKLTPWDRARTQRYRRAYRFPARLEAAGRGRRSRACT